MTLPFPLVSGTALWVDAAGTLLHPQRSVAEVYAAVARAHGHDVDAETVRGRLGSAMREHRGLRRGDPTWRAYWRAVVAACVGVDDAACFAELYAHYARPDAWRLAPGARRALEELRTRGVRTALISNWDDRLRSTLDGLGVSALFDCLVISGEEGVEKPDPEIFLRAAKRLNVPPSRSVMVGDSPENDGVGARSVGAFMIQFGSDISSFDPIVDS